MKRFRIDFPADSDDAPVRAEPRRLSQPLKHCDEGRWRIVRVAA